MSLLIVPDDGDELWPSLGGQVCDWIEANLCFGPGDLRGAPARLDDEKRALIWRMYEVYPDDHELAGRRRFKRVGISLAKGIAKTELAAWIAAAELHPGAPVRCIGWHNGVPIGGPVTDPYIPMVAYTEEQSDELAYGALKTILEESEVADDFDIGLERIMRAGGDGKAVSLATSPNARDGARTTFQIADEPLALDTPVPTPAGWRTIGEIAPGDYVFDRGGAPVRVEAVSEIKHDRPCFRVTFDDGDELVTDAAHRWKAVEWSNRPAGETVVTTSEMLAGGLDTGYGKRWRLPRPAGFDGADWALPLEPYLLGLWLGDGDARNATICAGDQDAAEIVGLIEGLGYRVTRCAAPERAPVFYVTLADSSFSGWGVATGGESRANSVVGILRRMGLLENKRIPSDYLFASRAQRLELLRGLMDSDGHASPDGQCTFVQGRQALAEDVAVLVRSLGVPARVVWSREPRARDGRIAKVHFTPEFCPFNLARKAARCRPGERRITRWPTIVSIEPCESVPVRCIAVATDDHLFQVGHGLRLTHNTHWWTLEKLRKAHQTMLANIPKRKAADAWALEVTTSFEPGTNSVAESTMDYARAVAERRVKDAKLFFFHRQASDEHDLETEKGARAAVIEASGPAAAWRDIDGIVELWRDPTTDRRYWERVWCNRPVQSSRKAFDVVQFQALAHEAAVKDGALITLGFDGAMFRDSTGLVATDVETGYQWVCGAWERPHGIEEWQVPTDEVDDCVRAQFQRFNVWRMYADPPYWQSWIAQWRGEFGDDVVIEWWTNRRMQMTYALESYDTAIREGAFHHDGDAALVRHMGNAHRHDLSARDENDRPLWLIRKERPDSPYKIDLAMAAVLSWEARTDAVASGADARSFWETA